MQVCPQTSSPEEYRSGNERYASGAPSTVIQSWRFVNNEQYRWRKAMVVVIFRMIGSETAPSYIRRFARAGNITEGARRLEYMLFQRAASLQEYLSPLTLGRRLQYLACCGIKHSNALKRGNLKRRNHFVPVSEKQGIQKKDWRIKNSPAFHFPGHTELVRHIFSFLSPVEVLRHRNINKFFAIYLPSTIETITLDYELMSRAFDGRSSSQFFAALSSLQAISIVASREPQSLLTQLGVEPLKRSAESLVEDFGDALLSGSLSCLESISIDSFFFHNTGDQALRRIRKALTFGACPRIRVLNLSGNFLSDSGAVEVSKVLMSENCKKLERVALQRNFIGENGIRAIAEAVVKVAQPKLLSLDFSCNLVTSAAMRHFSGSLGQALDLRSLEHMGFNDNYISIQEVMQLLCTLENGKCPSFKSLHLRENVYRLSDLHAQIPKFHRARHYCIETSE